MNLSFRCPNCGKRLKADESLAGCSAVCSRCGTDVTIPAAAETQVSLTDLPGDPAKSGGEAQARSVDRRSTQGPSERPPSEHALLLVKPVKKHAEDLIDMTAMVDIVFFLLIFFMVTSMQSLEAVIGLPAPQAQASSTANVGDFANNPNYLTVKIYDDDTVWLEDEEVFGAQDLRTRLRAARRADELLTGMLVVGSPEASHGTFVMVLDAGADAGLSELMFSVSDQIDAVSVGG